ncbi:MucB/RseB C-terminal domain-containing protein [Undibacterium sp. RuRC25W]|uniref:MucB/RseB C-terminal domain-containing protein n=1 Tax=Undibacterium sp. RuRC25W TaxID=3413047 RepID=UPI003BF1A11F
MQVNRFQLSFLVMYLGIGNISAFASGPSNTTDEKLEVQSLIKMIQSAPQKLNYSGTFVYQQASQIRTSKITHHVDANGELEKLEILDGNSREYVRKNDEVSCYLPDSKTVQVEKDVTQEVFPALLARHATQLPDFYTFKKGEVSRVAGLECQTYVMSPRDGARYGYRLCVEKQSGLLLRAQTVNNHDEVIEQIAFTQLKLGDIDKNKIKPSFQNLSQWHIENLTVQSNISSGWIVKSLPAGFVKTKELKRVISAPPSIPSGRKPPNSHQVIQMIFSDGMAAISVFIEPNMEQHSEGSLQQGAMTIMTKRQGDYWLTVVGEVPANAIRQVVNSIEFKPK